MQDCFRKYPEVYGEEIADEEAAEREAEAAAAGSPAAGGDVENVPPKNLEPATPAEVKTEKPEPVKVEQRTSSEAPSAKKAAHDATAANSKVGSSDAPKPVSSASPVEAPTRGDGSQELKDGLVDGQRAIPKRSFDATSANNEGSK